MAFAVAYWLLGRSDKQIEKERQENQIEQSRLTEMLASEQTAHDLTRQLLYEALKNKGDTP